MDVLLPQNSITLNHALLVETDFRVMQVSAVGGREEKHHGLLFSEATHKDGCMRHSCLNREKIPKKNHLQN